MKTSKFKMTELGPNATGGEKSHAETAESAEFKMTELGPIPKDWEVKRLGECGLFSKGAGISRAQANSGRIPAVRYGELYTTHHDYIKAFESFISDAVAKKSTRLTCGDIIFACSGETKEEIGKCAAFLGNEIAYAGGDLIIFSPESEYDSKFLALELNTSSCVSQKAAAGQGDAVVHIRRESLENLRVLLPPLAEQRRIAEALSDVDALLSAMTTLIKKKRVIKQGTMQELLGMRNAECGMRNVPRRRFAGFSGEWVEKRLGDCGSFSKGAGISRAQANTGRIPAVRYGELYTTHHEYIKAFESFISEDVARCSTKLTRGDIVFACSGETKEEIGKCAAFIGDEIAYAGGDLLILSPKEMYDSKFLAFELNTPFCASQKAAAGQGDAVVHIRQHSLEELIVRIPPTLVEQKAIAAVLSDMDAEIAALGAKRAKYESIKQGMMQELLTGKTRLKGE